jgi:hypothetical protein
MLPLNGSNSAAAGALHGSRGDKPSPTKTFHLHGVTL